MSFPTPLPVPTHSHDHKHQTVFAVASIFLSLILGGCFTSEAMAAEKEARPPESVYRGELVAFPGQWAFGLPRVGFVLTSDRDLEILSSDPDQPIDLSVTYEKAIGSLRERCKVAQEAGARTLVITFDHFFRQYRPGQEHPRTWMPDMDEYIEKIAKISKFAKSYGLGMELSLLTPLEIGRGYRKATGESGVWMQYRKGLRDPETGTFSVQLWHHRQWVNNKGVFDIEDAGVRVFAFREKSVHGTPYRVVPEDSIEEITDDIHVETLGESKAKKFNATRIRVFGKGKTKLDGLNRVLIVQSYRTPEMDFFSPKAKDYVKKLIDRYTDAGVKLNALYSDEPHLMADWAYYDHHEHGQFAMRFVTPGFVDQFAKQYGEKYRDFAKYLIYFTYGQEDFSHSVDATLGIMHTWGDSPLEIRETALFRSRYYRFLQDHLTQFLVEAKHYAERQMGKQLESRAHATWAESPTIDQWIPSQEIPSFQKKYEYTSDFLWSNTAQQVSVAGADYFRWGDFLTGNGNDVAECGYLDRNYYGLALACSTGIINEVPFSYGAHWGMPKEINERRDAVAQTFGTSLHCTSDLQDHVHRDVDVLMLYPTNLVAVEERFGGWVNQYAYCNYITQQKLIELGTVKDGAIEMAGRRFHTLVATFEPFPSTKLLEMMQQLAQQGGRVIWSGPVPFLTSEGTNAYAAWSALFGIDVPLTHNEGLPLPGRTVRFEGRLKDTLPQTILTHFLVDRVYPVQNPKETEVVARVGKKIVGTCRQLPGGGTATFLGFRPRDNQSCSLGEDTRTWFDVLNQLGAYPPSGKFKGVNDNTEYLSRTGDHIVCRFPNGTISIANHLKLLEENWPGGYGRNEKEDAAYLEKHPVPSDSLALKNFKVNGHTVDFEGNRLLSFRLDDQGNLLGFDGRVTKQITIDGQTTVFSDTPLDRLMFTPVPKPRRVAGGATFEILVDGTGTVRVPFRETQRPVQVFVEGPTPGSKGKELAVKQDATSLTLTITPEESGCLLWVVPQ